MHGIRIDINSPARLPYKAVLHALFFHPKLGTLFAVIKRCWFRNLLILLLLSACGACFYGCSQKEETIKSVGKIGDFFAESIGHAYIKNGKLEYEKELKDGHQFITLGNKRFDIVDELDQKVIDEVSASHYVAGTMLHPQGILLWVKPKDGGSPVITKTPIGGSMLRLLENSNRILREDGTYEYLPLFDRADFDNPLTIGILVFTIILCGLFASATELLSSILIFTIVIMVTRRHTPFGTLSGALSVATALCIPPTLVTEIYSQLGTGIAHETFFSISFVVYIIYMFLEGRNTAIGLRPMHPGEKPDDTNDKRQ